MSPALITALFFTVALFVTTAYFLLGSVPLLVLKHDTPLDARFVRGFFNIYYLAAMSTAGATALSFLAAGWWWVGAGATGLALLATLMRRSVIPRMEALGVEIQQSPDRAISSFRRWHLSAIAVNVFQLVVIVWTLIAAPCRPAQAPSNTPTAFHGIRVIITARPVLPGRAGQSSLPRPVCRKAQVVSFLHLQCVPQDMTPAACVSSVIAATLSARSRVSMNSFTLIGLVR